MNLYSNTAFIPQPSAITPGQAAVAQLYNRNPDTEIFSKGVYNWANSDRDPQCADEASRIFGQNLIDPEETDYAALMIGDAVLTRSGCSANPEAYFRAQGWTVPTGYGDYTNLTRIAGQRIMEQARANYDENQKRLEAARKDISELNNTLPSLIARSIRSAGGEKGEALTPEELQKLTKYGMREGAIQAQHRAATAWSYMSAWMNNIDSMQETGRDKLLDIANTLSDDKGKLDPLAMAAFVLMVDEKATELQSSNSQFWADFADKFQNFWRTTIDQSTKTGIGSAFAVSSLPELQPTWGQQYQAPEYYGDERVEKLYGYLNQAINTAISPSEKAEWHAKLLSEMGGLVGESIVPMAAGVAAGAALAPAGAFAAAVAGYGTGVAASAPSTINNAIGNAYIKGVINPELYGTLEGIGQAAAENTGGPATSLKLFAKTAGKLTNYAASRAAGSRFLANQYARTTLNYLTAGAFESVTELAEEEIGGFIGSKLNAIARSMGFEVSPQAYKLGETLKGMKSHEVAAIFGYSYALGMFGIPANFRSARTFAKNTDNLLKAGHTAKTARDIQHRAFQTEDKIAEIQADTSLSAEQKAEAIRKEEQNFATYQKTKFTNDVLSDPQFRSRLEKEGANIRDEAEVALDVEHEADIQILKEHNILEAVVLPGEKYRMSFYEEGELQADGTRAPGKITTQEWTRMQLTNWLMLQKDTRIEQDLRSFQALLLAHAHAQSATVEETKTHFQNLGANRPLAALGELHKNGMTPGFFQKAAQQALDLQRQHQAEGMTEQEAAQQPSPNFEGLSLGEVQNLATGAAQRKEQESATTGALQNISDTTNVEYGGLNILASDGTALIKYVAGRASILDILEERFEADIKQRTRGNKNLYNQLAETLLHIQSHLPGNIQLLDPKKKGNYTKSDFVEAYSKIATGAFLYNEKNLPINAAGHRLIQNIGRAVDTTRMFQTIGNAWLTYANSPEGKAHLEAGGQTIADIMQQAGFTFSNQLATARATAQQRAEVLEARNWQPAIEEELDALLEEAEEESELNEINEQEAKEPITIPADQSITGKEITIEPAPSEQETLVSSPDDSPAANLSGAKATTILSRMRDLIAKGKARAEHFAIVFREIPGLTEAQAIEQGIRPLTQRGEPTAAYTQGKLLAERCTDAQYLLLKSGKLSQKAKRDILAEPAASNIDAQGRPIGDKWPTVSKAKQGKLTTEQTRAAIYKALKLTTSKDSTRTPLRLIKHQIKRGRESFVSTTGTQLSIISRPSKEANIENIYSPITGHYTTQQQAGVHFPLWEQTVPVQMDKATTFDIDLADFRFLEKYPTQGKTFKEVVINGTRNTYATLEVDGQTFYFNLANIRNAVKQLATLARELGFPSQVKLHSWGPKSPIRITAKHNGWTWDYITLPLELRTLSDNIVTIPLNPQQDSPANFSIKITKETIQKATANQLGSNKILPLCSCPPVLLALGEKNADVVTMAHILRKIATQHFLSDDQIYEVIEKFEDPEYVFKDKKSSYVFIPGVIAQNKTGNLSDVEAPIILERTKDGQHYMASAYALDSLQKINALLKDKKLVYAKTTATPNTNGVPAVTQNFEHLVRGSGFNSNILTKADIVNFNSATSGISDSFTASDAEDSLFTDSVLEAENAIVTQPDVNFSIKAMHASPHNFRKFSTDFMSSGTGGQWYGWGLYFTQGAAAAQKYFEGFKKKIPNPVAYQVELNVNDDDLIDWEGGVPDSVIHKLIADNPDMPDFVKKNIRGSMNGADLYRYLKKWQERLVDDLDDAPKATSLLLLKSGIKGIRHQDNKSWAGNNLYGDYHYVIFSGDDIKITAVNETGIWSMDEGWEDYTDPTAAFSIRAANPSTLDRFTADPLGERIVHTVRTEARRYARVLGDKTPQEQAMNAIASAESIINAVDKYLHRPDKPVSRRHRDQLTKLRSIIEKYAQIIASGTPRSFKRISPAEQQELQAAIAELEAAELATAETDPALLIEDDKRMNKRTREARSREHHRAIVREAAKGRVYKVLAAMLDTTADALDDYLKDQLLTKLQRLTATVAIKRTPSKRLKGKMTAPMYRELEQSIQLMAYSTRQKEDAIDTILTAHETLAQAIASNDDNLTRGNTLLIELAHQLEQEGTPVTAKNLTAALAAHEARVAIFADITSKNYEQTRTAANAIYHIIRYGRALWQQKHEAREAEIQTYLRHFLANTTAEQGKANAINEMLDKFKWRDALSLNATMNAAQTLLALSSYEPLRPIMQKVLENYATASVARQKHLQEMRKQELYIFGRIIGIKPATQAGYSNKQLRELSDKFDTFYTENNQTKDTGITVTWQERNEDGVLETYTSKPLQLTKWEALNLILTYRQQDYQTNAQIHGYTDEVLTKLEKFIGTDLMDFGNGIQNALINDGTIAVYEEREGIPMRSNPLYWPGNININTLNTTREEPLVNPYHPAAGHDFLHTRVRHRNEIAHLNAFTVWRKAVADRANYIYSAPVTSHLESLLARQQFAGRLKTLIGEGLFRQLKATIAEIKNAAWQETSLQDVNNTIIATAFASKSLAVLSGNPGSLVRQLSAVANAGLMPGLTTRKFMQYAIGLKQGQGHIGITDILKLDSFTTRERDNAYVNEMLAMGNNVKFSRLMDWAKAGMNAMDKLDLLANAFSAAIVYNHKYDQLKSLGTLTEEQIKKQCENAVAVYTKLLAQPLNRTDKSAIYWKIGHDTIGRAVLFMSSESINKIGMLRANYIRLRNEGKNPAYALGAILGTMGITVGLTAAITEAAFALLTGSLPDDDDNIAAWATALWLNASYGQYLGSLPLIGGVTDSFFSPYGGYFSGDFRIPGKDAWERGGKLIKMLTDDKTYTAAQWEKETTRFMRDFTAVLGFAGGAYSRWQTYSRFAAFSHSFTAALNVLYPIARGVEAHTSTSTRKRKPRRSKSLVEQWLTPESK